MSDLHFIVEADRSADVVVVEVCGPTGDEDSDVRFEIDPPDALLLARLLLEALETFEGLSR